ncbi:YdeI/OmpD-associated family protein [Pseudoduganella umbonata]|uniref:DUF1905 domain-containing protein n=1 Tax=Pseudoduganella umbonata TaxID=864828 RepID=A0A4P8HIB8_9BURK|nr:YdeI/OmpD-associated family protein [Pseudoduganella umbonata]MBB3224961.1 hypothetical protein [Pseudoduganella umbonata]QCP09237.1 DUF1905 domain-containing protein [Pseudoduganella umbonata]
MKTSPTDTCFEARLLRPADFQGEDPWAFAILPKAESDRFARRGRTSAEGWLNGQPFQAILEPDGQLSHWLKIPAALLKKSGAQAGELVTLALQPLADELEPQMPPDLLAALAASPQAGATWDSTTTIARIDWIHWIGSAKQEKTRLSRIADACDMLAEGKKRVCCFDPSGYYSKALRAPRQAP